MNIRRIVTAVTLCLATSAGAVNYSNEVLAIGVGARALGMGGAFVSVADDSTAVYWNPAGLTQVKHVEISAIQQGRSDAALSSGLNEVGSQYFFMTGAMNFGPLGAFGASFMRFGVKDIPYIPVGSITLAGEPLPLGNFGTQDFGFLGSWGKQWHPAFATGLGVKFLGGGTTGLQSGDASYTYYGVDLSTRIDFGKMTTALEGLRFGLNLQDVGNSGVSWKNTPTNPTDKVDMNPKVGMSYSPPFQFLKDSQSVLTLAFDADPKYGANTLLHFGGEFWYKDVLAFRGGARYFLGGLQNMEPTIGASFKFYILQLDYAFINYELTPIHYLSLAVKF